MAERGVGMDMEAEMQRLQFERAEFFEQADLWRGAWEAERGTIAKLREENERLRQESEALRGASITFFTHDRAELQAQMRYQENRISEILEAVLTFSAAGDLENVAVPEGTEADDFFYLAKGINQMVLEIRARMDDTISARRFLTEVLESMRDGLLVCGQDGHVRQANSAIAILLGYRLRDLLDKNLADLFGSRPTWLEGGAVEECAVLRQDDQQVQVQVSVALLGEGCDNPEWVLVLHDLSERMELEEKRREAAYRGGMEEINASVLHNIGNAVGGLMAKSERMLDALGALDKSARLLEKGMTLNDPARLHKGLAQAVADLDRIRSEGLAEPSQTIRDGIEHIADIVRAQQSMARGGGLYATLFSLVQTVQDTLALERESLGRMGIQVETRLERGPVEVFLPKNPFQQLLLNLIKNARESIGARMEAGSLRLGEGRVVIAAEMLSDGYFGLELRDNGAGMETRVQDRVFEYGMTTKASGSGFGLHSAANFVQSIDGEITLESDGPDCGAVASLVLPVRMR